MLRSFRQEYFLFFIFLLLRYVLLCRNLRIVCCRVCCQGQICEKKEEADLCFDRRLLYLLIDDRSASSKLHENLLLNTALQVVKALDFLSQKHLVLRDVTTYNMIYVLTKDEHGVTKDITVKIADLGLTHQYKNDDYYANPNIRRRK